MTAYQVYEQAIKPLSTDEKMAIARLIINEVIPEPVVIEDEEQRFEYMKRLLPNIKRITFTNEDLASMKLEEKRLRCHSASQSKPTASVGMN